MNLKHKEIIFLVLFFSVFGIFISQDAFASDHYSCPSSYSQNEITYDLSGIQGQGITDDGEIISLECTYKAIIDEENSYAYFQVDFLLFDEGEYYVPQENDCSGKVVEEVSESRINYEYFYSHVYVKESYDIQDDEYYSEVAATCLAQTLTKRVIEDAYFCPGYEDLSLTLECDTEEEPDEIVETSSDETEAPDGLVSQQNLPDWIKDNAGWWAEGLITDDDFSLGIGYLINEGIILVPQTEVESETTDEIPDWIKFNAGWWAEGIISDDEFINGIQYLISTGIISVTSN